MMVPQQSRNGWAKPCPSDTDVAVFKQNLVLFGTEIDIKTDTVFDLAILQAKQFIYKCKLDKCLPTLSCFLQKLMLKYKIDEYNAKISGELPTFILNWLCYKSILKTEN